MPDTLRITEMFSKNFSFLDNREGLVKVPEIEPLRNVDWLAEMLGISKPTIYRIRAAGKGDQLPPAVMIGRQPRWQASTVAAWLKEREGESWNEPAA